MIEQTIPELLLASAQKHAGRNAVEEDDKTISYLRLEEQASRLAHLLAAAGAAPGDRVALYLEKSIDAVVALYGILKAGCIYVPLDPVAPLGRLAYILRDCGIEHILTSSSKRADCIGLTRRAPVKSIVVLDASPDSSGSTNGHREFTRTDLYEQACSAPALVRSATDAALILYTSGSTGKPKGVTLSHQNVLAFVDWAARRFGVGPDDRLSSHAPFHFDLSTFDLFASSMSGASVVLVPSAISAFPRDLAHFIQNREITTWYSVPSILTMLALRGGLEQLDLKRLRTVLFAGEVFPVKHLRRCMEQLSHARFVNLYGPTETNVCTFYEVGPLKEGDDRPVPIGVAIEGVEVFAMAGEDLAEDGQEGELLVKGSTVMMGYWGQPELTARVLIKDPRVAGGEGRVYRTGDLVTQDPDGNYRFQGRRDEQIKTRGFRVELGEIEAALQQHPAVIECAACPVPDELVTNRIKAFVTAKRSLTPAELFRFCSERLPGYMVPESFELRGSLPKTSTGKIDRQALKEEAIHAERAD